MQVTLATTFLLAPINISMRATAKLSGATLLARWWSIHSTYKLLDLVTFNTRRVLSHEPFILQYSRYGTDGSFAYDYMLFKIEAVTAVGLEPIALNTDSSFPSDGEILTTIGFGVINEDEDIPEDLLKINVNVVPNDECDADYEASSTMKPCCAPQLRGKTAARVTREDLFSPKIFFSLGLLAGAMVAQIQPFLECTLVCQALSSGFKTKSASFLTLINPIATKEPVVAWFLRLCPSSMTRIQENLDGSWKIRLRNKYSSNTQRIQSLRQA